MRPRVWRGVALVSGTIGLLLAACSGPAVGTPTASPSTALSLTSGRTLAAIGVKPQGTKGAAAAGDLGADRRVAFGITNLLAESFYETGKFRLVEATDLRQRQLIVELVELFWSASRPPPSASELGSIGSRLEAELLAYAVVTVPRTSGQRIQLGPLGSYQQRLRVDVEVCLYAVATQQTLCRQGAGTAQQDGVGVIYEFRNDRPDFERNALGRATKQAVGEAVQAVVAGIRFTP
jgi:hypothetical protein